MKYIIIDYQKSFKEHPNSPPYDTFDVLNSEDNRTAEQVVEDNFMFGHFLEPVTKEGEFYIPQSREQKIKVINIREVSKEEWDEAWMVKFS